jgi:hypothetical protein
MVATKLGVKNYGGKGIRQNRVWDQEEVVIAFVI